jgi:hypothetical protein
MANTYDMTVLPLFLDSDTTTRTLAFEAAFSLLQSVKQSPV